MLLLLAALACTENELVNNDKASEGDDTQALFPDIEVSPVAIDFGELVVGDSASEVVTIENVGDDDLNLVDLGLLTASPMLSHTALSGPVLAPGESDEIVLTYAPTALGTVSDTLRVSSSDPDEPESDVVITGGTLEPAIQLSPLVYDYGTLEIDTGATMEVLVESVGAAPLTISATSYAATSSELSVLDDSAVITTLAPGESVIATMQYNPIDETGDEGAWSVFSDDPAQPEAIATQIGNGERGITEYELEFFLTADDAWQGWLDGAEFNATNQSAWSYSDTVNWTLETGDHVIAIYATDVGSVISGFISVLSIDGVPTILTGGGHWKMTNSAPSSSWTTWAYDASAWPTEVTCADNSTWGTYWPADFYTYGADWIWWTDQCRDLQEAWFRLEFTLD